jgi:hypothetical protein
LQTYLLSSNQNVEECDATGGDRNYKSWQHKNYFVESRDLNKNSDPQKAPSGVWGRILVTAALPYANGPLHIGHIAGRVYTGGYLCAVQTGKKNGHKICLW